MEIEKKTVKYDDGFYTEIYHKKGDNNFLHREDGPAVIRYDRNDIVLYGMYFIDGNQVSKKEWERDYGWKAKLKGTPMGEIFLTSSTD